MAIDRGAGQDLRTYLSENGPLPPERAALLVAGLAEQLAAVHAGGHAYREVGPEAVRVNGPGSGEGVSVSISAQTIPLTVQAASSNVRDAGVLLARLLGGAPGGGCPEGAPPALWHLVESCVGAGVTQRPGAALLAQRLRDAGQPPPVVPVPRYLPYARAASEPSLGWRSHWTGRALVVATAGVLAIALAGTGVLLTVARGHLPFANPGLVRQASHWNAPPGSPRAPASSPATGSPADAGVGGAPTDDPSAPGPGDGTNDPSAPGPGDGTNVGTAPGPDGTTTPPPPPPPPPVGEAPPTPGTHYRTSTYDVPAGATRPPFVRGELIWYNRSVGVSAVVSSTSPCAAAVFSGYAGGKQVSRIATAYRCGNDTVSQNLDGRTIVGGITQVLVDLYVNGRLIGRDSCLRSTGRCTRA